jgi:hypothetical protein
MDILPKQQQERDRILREDLYHSLGALEAFAVFLENEYTGTHLRKHVDIVRGYIEDLHDRI